MVAALHAGFQLTVDLVVYAALAEGGGRRCPDRVRTIGALVCLAGALVLVGRTSAAG